VCIYIHVVDDPDWTQKFLAPAVYSDTRTLLSKFLRQNTFCVETFSWDDWSVHVSRRRGSYHGSMTPESALQFVCCTNTFYTLLSSIWSLWSCLWARRFWFVAFATSGAPSRTRGTEPTGASQSGRRHVSKASGGRGAKAFKGYILIPFWSISPVPKEVSCHENGTDGCHAQATEVIT